MTRGDYLRNRVLLVAVVFTLLTPLWGVVDLLITPASIHTSLLLARLAMIGAFILVIVRGRRSATGLNGIRHLLATLILTPALFYLLVLLILGDHVNKQLFGYSFTPFLLIAFLSVFPLTLIESLGLGLILIALEVFSQYINGLIFTGEGWQDLWLMCLLLIISLWANFSAITSLLRLYRQASQDPLTGLLNRGVLMVDLARLIDRLHSDHRGRCVTHSLTLLMLDLDRFKRINDLHGHSTGDQVLKRFANILREESRKTDILARYGGEEFIVALPGTVRKNAIQVAERIRKRCENCSVRSLNGQDVNFTTSIGVAELRREENIETLLERVDARLYAAKAQGRNLVVTT
ncbi:GGDEF domain-containing protein [Kushneria aurantia]|uniref:diguanylate cyclase n=1 Tax=Kushneria aurantia TaxID=504092 RepID=A0ABV6G6X5_9GAMM|nr:GGDEF domain-containing protein [Kushneria aurantia]